MTGQSVSARPPDGTIAGIDFFDTAFGAAGDDQAELHARVIATLLDEMHGWHDEPLVAHDGPGGERDRQ